jgi:hypothetical protein
MDNTTFNELLEAGEFDLILMDGPQALTKKQLKILDKTVDSIGRNIPQTMQKKATFNPMKMVEMLGAGTQGIFSRMMGKPLDKDKQKLKNKTSPSNKASSLNKVYYTTISEGVNTPLRKGDSMAVILAKMFNFMKKAHDEKIKRYELDENFEKERLYESIRTKQSAPLPKPKVTLIKKESLDFSTILKTLGFIGLLIMADKAQAKILEFITAIKETKQRISDGITKIQNWFRDINILGYKPFESIFGPKKQEIRATSLAQLVRQAEGGDAGYDALVIPKGGIPREFKNYKPTEMTIREVLQLQDKMAASKKFPSTAIGGYQLINSTLKLAVNFLDLNLNDKFTPELQDRIFNEYIIQQKRPEIGAYIRGEKGATLEEAQLGLAKEFASFGVPEDIAKKSLKKGESYYKGVGDNVSSVSLDTSTEMLKQSKILQESRTADTAKNITPTTPVPKISEPQTNSKGEKISQLSRENMDNKRDVFATNIIIDNTTSNNIFNKNKQQVLSIPSSLDLPLFLQGMVQNGNDISRSS